MTEGIPSLAESAKWGSYGVIDLQRGRKRMDLCPFTPLLKEGVYRFS
jgi:hypothetical protein